jgi:ParB family transcriptional regulator, chromosome partitioning protein
MAKKFSASGINALLKTPQQLEQAIQDNPQEVMRELAANFAEIPLAHIQRYSDQPRQDFDEEKLAELADSIRVHGVIQPITVRRMGPEAYQLISGERRFRASQLAGLETIPAYIRLADDQVMMEMALIENIQREDLNPIEVATTYARLKEEFNLTDEALSERVGKKDRSTITNYMRLLKLDDGIILALKNREITFGHGRALIAVTNRSLQDWMFERISKDHLSVRALESLTTAFNKAGNAEFKNWLIERLGVENSSAMSIVPLLQTFFALPSDAQGALLYQIHEKALSIRDVENLLAKATPDSLLSDNGAAAAKSEPKPRLTEALRKVQDQFSTFFGAKVQLKRDEKGKGQLVINFDNDAELNRLLDTIQEPETAV